MHWELCHEEEREGFTIRLYAAPENDVPIADSFDASAEEIAELEDKVGRSLLYWFVARVTASKAGIVLGEDYRGACLYDSVDAFREGGGYYPDMVDAAIGQARAKLVELAAPTE